MWVWISLGVNIVFPERLSLNSNLPHYSENMTQTLFTPVGGWDSAGLPAATGFPGARASQAPALCGSPLAAEQNTADWVPAKQQAFIAGTSGACKSKMKVPSCSGEGLGDETESL